MHSKWIVCIQTIIQIDLIFILPNSSWFFVIYSDSFWPIILILSILFVRIHYSVSYFIRTHLFWFWFILVHSSYALSFIRLYSLFNNFPILFSHVHFYSLFVNIHSLFSFRPIYNILGYFSINPMFLLFLQLPEKRS